MSPKRRILAFRGRRGDGAKAVEDVRADRVIVYYRDAAGEPRKRKYPRTREGREEAKAFVEGWHEERKRLSQAPQVASLATHEVWSRYAEAELTGLRGATILSYQYHWRRWEAFIGRERLANTVTVEDCARFRAEMRRAGGSLNQARQTLQIVRGVYRWGVAARLVQDAGVLAFRWKRRKDDPKPIEPDEYSAAEFEQLLRAIDRDGARQWRAWVFLMLAGHHGQRARAVLHLRWQDVDEAAGVIRWPAEFQKQGVELVQPIMWETVSALRVARAWRATAAGYRVRAHHTGAADPARLNLADWILFAERDKARAMSYTSMHHHLMEAEKRAGVQHRAYRGAHGFRRYVVGEIIARTGDRMLGLEYVGDQDAKMLKSYDRRLAERIAGASSALGNGPEASRAARSAADIVTNDSPTSDITKV